MKFTFASLLLLLVHTLVGAPLAAQTTRDTASSEINPVLGIGEDAGFDLDKVDDVAVSTCCQLIYGSGTHAAALTSTAQAEPVPVHHLTQALPGEQSFDLPLKWGSGDRLALDEGKP